MNQSPHKGINNSYESASSGSATSSSSIGDTTATAKFMNLSNNGYALSSLLLSTSGNDFELYNTSAEEGIFPNIVNACPVHAPSYEPEYDYYNQYSTQPLVYSWMPIVPGFLQERSENIQKFDSLVKKLQPQPLNISNISTEGNSSIVSDQNAKFGNSLILNNSDSKHYILNNSSGMTFNHQLEDSCNAMDLNISCNIQKDSTNLDLSFNGKIPELTTTGTDDSNQLETVSHEKLVDIEKLTSTSCDATANLADRNEDECANNADEEDEESDSEKLRNESFELLKQEDTTKMLLISKSEKSPDVVNDTVSDSNDEGMDDDEQHETDLIQEQSDVTTANIKDESTIDITTRRIPTLKDHDDFLFNKFQTSLSELCPPPSIATLPLSLSEIIAIYKKNSEKPQETFASVKSNSMFIPSHPLNEAISMEWPQVAEVKAHGIMYNRSTDCEHIEFMTVKYVERFIKAETSSSYNHKVGPASAKKKVERLKLLTQSPSSRLSHLANRRKIFSSANLKSTSATTSHKTFANSKQLLIDKSKLYQKKRGNSTKKKTPGKRKTPKSAKRQNISIPKPETTVVSSKRALFISPMKLRKEASTSNAANTRDVPIRGHLPKRNLFSPQQNAKRKRSPSPDDENRYGKTRRLDSPSKIMKSKSFSVAAASSSGSLDEHFRKKLYYRTQSEVTVHQSMADRNSSLGFRKAFTETEKRKLLWTASTVLQAKKIDREHEKFKEHMSTLCRLIKRAFIEFYNPTKSVSAQMSKFATLMVFYVIQGRPVDDIYAMVKTKLEANNSTKVSGYIGKEDYQKNHYIRKNSSLLLMSASCSSLNLSENNDSILDSTFERSGSDTSLNRSSSKVAESNVLRENLSNNIRDNSTKKLFSGSDSNLNAVKTSTPSSNVLKAKRQISF